MQVLLDTPSYWTSGLGTANRHSRTSYCQVIEIGIDVCGGKTESNRHSDITSKIGKAFESESGKVLRGDRCPDFL